MGWTQKRKTKAGVKRFRACYRDIRGQIQSAGTFAKERDADKAWQRAELKIAEGRLGDPRRGRQTFRRYVTEEWLAGRNRRCLEDTAAPAAVCGCFRSGAAIRAGPGCAR